MNPEAFMEKFGIEGFFLSRNGPRLYVYRVRYRVALTDGSHTQERAFINLDDYSVTVRIDVPNGKEHWRRQRLEHIRARLLPVARMARILKVKPQRRMS
jgi:hypothetical protein